MTESRRAKTCGPTPTDRIGPFLAPADALSAASRVKLLPTGVPPILGPPDMHILGLSAFFHDSAACLVHDGRIVAAAQEERDRKSTRLNSSHTIQSRMPSSA